MAINKEAVELAKLRLIENIRIPDYYMDYVDESLDLDAYNRDCCPLHDEDSPSFFYFDDSGRFHCFGCDKYGTVVDLHYYIKNRNELSYTMIRAIKDLSEMYNIEIPNLFKSVDLKEKLSLGGSSKLRVKSKDELVKPIKRDITDIENLIVKNKHLLDVNRFIYYIGHLDRYMFIDGDVIYDINNLKKELMEELNRLKTN